MNFNKKSKIVLSLMAVILFTGCEQPKPNYYLSFDENNSCELTSEQIYNNGLGINYTQLYNLCGDRNEVYISNK